MRSESPWGGLAVRVALGAALAALTVVAARFLSLGISPAPAVLVGVVVGAATWVFGRLDEPPVRPPWEQPQPPAHATQFQADVTTRRLATMLAHAQPGREFESGAVARTLTDLVEQRLVRNHNLPADDPLAHADAILSPALLAYTRASRSDRPPTLGRRALHAHLKEIDEL